MRKWKVLQIQGQIATRIDMVYAMSYQAALQIAQKRWPNITVDVEEI